MVITLSPPLEAAGNVPGEMYPDHPAIGMRDYLSIID
jgi:hypothetical protein